MLAQNRYYSLYLAPDMHNLHYLTGQDNLVADTVHKPLQQQLVQDIQLLAEWQPDHRLVQVDYFVANNQNLLQEEPDYMHQQTE